MAGTLFHVLSQHFTFVILHAVQLLSITYLLGRLIDF